MTETKSPLLYEKTISENLEKGFQVRLTVSVFREIEYMHLRKYFLSFEGEWIPSQEGIGIPLTIENSYALLEGCAEICSGIEEADCLSEQFKDLIKNLNLTLPT